MARLSCVLCAPERMMLMMMMMLLLLLLLLLLLSACQAALNQDCSQIILIISNIVTGLTMS